MNFIYLLQLGIRFRVFDFDEYGNVSFHFQKGNINCVKQININEIMDANQTNILEELICKEIIVAISEEEKKNGLLC